MNAVIPTGEATDSDFGAFAAISLADAEKARAAKHYTAMAAEAAAMFKTIGYQRNSWELYAAESHGSDRSTSVIADKMGHVRLAVTGSRSSNSTMFTPAEARALAAELVKAAEALA